MRYGSALIVGAGSGVSAALARLFARHGIRVALAARDTGKLAAIAAETGAQVFAGDASRPDDVARLFDAVAAAGIDPDIVIYNAAARARGSLLELDPEAVRHSLLVSAYGGFLVAQQAVRRMLARGGSSAEGRAIGFTGASASVKGYPQSAPFAMGKFALRGLAQSMAREFGPRGIHVFHVVIDGAIRNPGRSEPQDAPDSMLDPAAIAETYWHTLQQPRSAWSFEVELRPWVERF